MVETSKVQVIFLREDTANSPTAQIKKNGARGVLVAFIPKNNKKEIGTDGVLVNFTDL